MPGAVEKDIETMNKVARRLTTMHRGCEKEGLDMRSVPLTLDEMQLIAIAVHNEARRLEKEILALSREIAAEPQGCRR